MKRFIAAMGTDHPTVSSFNQVFNQSSNDKRECIVLDLTLLATYSYEELPLRYRRFIQALIAHNRQQFVDFIVHTVIGSLRVEMPLPHLFLKFIAVLLQIFWHGKANYRLIAMLLLLVFDLPYKVRTVAEYLQRSKFRAEDFLMLLGKIEVTDDLNDFD
jgi:hypothetical protein